MAEPVIEKITSEVSAYYATVNQYRPNNDLALRTKVRKAIQVKLQPYVDGKLIDSFIVICDESNNDTRDIKKPVKLEVVVKLSKSSPKHIISFPAQKSSQGDRKTANKGDSMWEKSKGGAESLWDRLFTKRPR